jgi:hypothetical protein
MRIRTLALAALLLGGISTIGTPHALAAPAGGGSSLANAAAALESPVIRVQNPRRRGGPGFRGQRGPGPGGRGRRGRGGIGPGGAAAIGVIGAIGTMIAIDAARQRAEADANYDSAVQYCIDTFRSYDLRTRSYLGHDGYRHSCP